MSDHFLVDERYLDWIYDIVDRKAENTIHYELFNALYSYEFVMLVPNDDNRCSDGVALRREFLRADRSVQAPRDWLVMGCSVLEMLVGVARHLSFEMDGEIGEWFWHLVENLSLTRYEDKRFNEQVVNQTLERLVWRQYSYDGKGGLFPLKRPHEDQRRVEIWFQMESYMLEW